MLSITHVSKQYTGDVKIKRWKKINNVCPLLICSLSGPHLDFIGSLRKIPESCVCVFICPHAQSEVVFHRQRALRRRCRMKGRSPRAQVSPERLLGARSQGSPAAWSLALEVSPSPGPGLASGVVRFV